MTTETDNLPDDLDEFNALLTGQTETPEEPEKEEVAPEDDTPAPAEDGDDENELVDNPEPDDTRLKVGKPKLTAKERIEQLNAKFREAEREKEELKRRLDETLAIKPEKTEVKEKPEETGAPDPNAVDEKGEPLYPLGDIDPKYAKDLIDYTVKQELEAFKADQRKTAEEARKQEAAMALEVQWMDKMSEAAERIPDLRESGQKLEPVFNRIDDSYAEYLATTLKTLDNGPEVLYYLSKNLEEAERIFSSTPFEATLALGGLNAMVKPSVTESPKKVTDAPPPPPIRTRGTGGKFSVAPDTDDLASFEQEFFRR